MGRSPLTAFSVYFVEPLTQSYSLQAIAVKATPLVLIATWSGLLLSRQFLEHRRRGPVHRRRRARRLARASDPRRRAPGRARQLVDPAGDDDPRRDRRRALRADPGAVARPAQRLGNSHQPDVGLCRPARAGLAGARTVEGSGGPQPAGLRQFRSRSDAAASRRRRLAASGRAVRADRGRPRGAGLLQDAVRLFRAPGRLVAARGALRRFRRPQDRDLRFHDFGRAGGAGRRRRSVRQDRPAAAFDLAGLRLFRDHRRLPRPAVAGSAFSSPGSCWPRPSSAARTRRSRCTCPAT